MDLMDVEDHQSNFVIFALTGNIQFGFGFTMFLLQHCFILLRDLYYVIGVIVLCVFSDSEVPLMYAFLFKFL